ncbi:MAG: ECF transporter S component [Clostridia bacterium]|nr:ECF transporter S component [Clostridia bacterium]
MNISKIKSITLAGLMAAVIFVFTFTFKVPIGPLGYAHLGDAFIIVSVWLLGGKKAWGPAALGAGLADFAAGYTMWILPTVIVKALFAFTIFIVAEIIFKSKYYGYIIGVIIGAAVHIAGYSVAWLIIGGKAGLISAILPLVMQTTVGAVLGTVIISVLGASKQGKALKQMAK